jgi:chromosome partitioning protein
MMHTFAFCSFKGGTSKTSIAMHVGAWLAKFHKKRVLLVDFDSQANLSIGLGIGPDNLKTMVPVLQGQAGIKDVIQETSIPGLCLIPANAYLDGIERTPQLGNDPYAHERLRRALKCVENDFDFCFADTPPSLGWLTQAAFFASQFSVICAIPEAYSVIALRRLKEFQNSIRQYHDIEVFGVVLSFWDERGAVNKQFLDEIDSSFPNRIFDAKVRRDMAVSRAVLKGKTVFDFDKDGRAAFDYKALSDEFLKRFNRSFCTPPSLKDLFVNSEKRAVEDVKV